MKILTRAFEKIIKNNRSHNKERLKFKICDKNSFGKWLFTIFEDTLPKRRKSVREMKKKNRGTCIRINKAQTSEFKKVEFSNSEFDLYSKKIIKAVLGW